jgi:uncharacterized membrane protein
VAIIAACAEREAPPADTAVQEDTNPGVLSVLPIPLPIRALGTEPFWAMDVDSSGLHFTTPDNQAGIHFPPVAGTLAGDTTAWSGEADRVAVEVRVWREQCSDGMSDRVYPYTARVRVDTTSYQGCADTRPPG